MEYNTSRGQLRLKEYGRNVQQLAEFLKTVEDDQKRLEYAEIVVEMMKQLNQNLKGSNDHNQKVWDDLHIISDFGLMVESPFPLPDKELLYKKPERIAYKSNEVKLKHYGRNIELMISQAIEMEDNEQKEGAIIAIGRLMKSFFGTWNKDYIEDKLVISHIKKLSKNKLDINLEKVEEFRLFDSSKKDRQTPSHNRQDKTRHRQNNLKRKKKRNSYNNY